jgi:hypothetical protein
MGNLITPNDTSLQKHIDAIVQHPLVDVKAIQAAHFFSGFRCNK